MPTLEMTPVLWGAFGVAAYLLGSIPFGLLIAKKHGIDIRAHGSGNIGATNVRRTVGKGPGNLCFALDVLKGLIPGLGAGLASGLAGAHLDALLADGAAPDSMQSLAWLGVSACAIIGHMFPVWLRFKGGKGVATGFGAMLGLFPVMTVGAFAALGVWLLSLKVSRYVGVSSCLAAATLPVVALVLDLLDGSFGELWPFLVVAGLLALVVIAKHTPNLRRTFAGTEPRVGEGRGGARGEGREAGGSV